MFKVMGRFELKKPANTAAGRDSNAPARSRRPGGRPRSATSRRAVLDAAYAILVKVGLGGFSVEAVAARSGVARSTVYRWWPTKGLLAFESYREAFKEQLVFKRTESPKKDLRE